MSGNVVVDLVLELGAPGAGATCLPSPDSVGGCPFATYTDIEGFETACYRGAR